MLTSFSDEKDSRWWL